jgi:AAA15 family ATPase/GTPase
MVYNTNNYSEVQAKWNMDEAQLRRVDYLLTLATVHFQNWNLEDLYWVLRSIRREINAKLKQEEKRICENKLNALSKRRTLFVAKKITQQDFFIDCEEFYLFLTEKIKKHGIYFRENEDYGL